MPCASKTMQRFEVKFKNQRIFVNAGDAAGALAMARVRFIKVYREAGVIDKLPELGHLDTFKVHATATVSDRY